MNTLQLHRIPDGICRKYKSRHKRRVAILRRTFDQERTLTHEELLPRKIPRRRPGLVASRRWLEQQVWPLPVLDQRSAEEILGYGDDGLCG
jgi:hypothetical protein